MSSNPTNGNDAFPDDMEALLFTNAVRAAVPTQPDPQLRAVLIPRLAAAARASTLEAETRTVGRGTAGVPARRHRSRRGLVARVGIAVAAIPLLLAGLAVAGVTVPSPARSAFDSVGITLPNQPSKGSHPSSSNPAQPASQGTETQGSETQGTETSGATPTKGNSKAAHEHARQQHEKAQGKALGHEKGKAVGLNDEAPPGQTGQTGPPANSNAGGNSSNAHSTHPPKGVANGHSKSPPGHTRTPPGHAKTTPGQAKVPPGQAKK
jgi:hypothetical protein